MIKPFCFKCRNEIYEFGGILLAPQTEFETGSFENLGCGLTYKFHLCVKCYNLVFDFIKKHDI